MKESMKRVNILLIVLLISGFCFQAVAVVKADSPPKYNYISDTERWYYEKQAYERPYYYWVKYPYYYNYTHYDLLYYPYYTMGYSYRNVKVYEYYLTVKSDLPGTSLGGEGWYKEGSTATITTDDVVKPGEETQYHFIQWSGDYTGNTPISTITIDKAKTVIAHYQASHHLQVLSTPPDALGYLDDAWYTEGTTRVLQSAPTTITVDPGTRYVFDSWYVDGVKTAGNPISLTVDTARRVEARYTLQYYLDVRSFHGSPYGTGWYDEGATASFEVSTPLEAGTGRQWVFEGWGGDIVSSSPQGTTLMDGPKTITASWRLDSTLLYTLYGLLLVAVVAVFSILALVLSRSGRGVHIGKPAYQCMRCGYGLAREFQYCPLCGSKRADKQSKVGKGT